MSLTLVLFSSPAGIPQVAILTKIDKVCSEIQKDLKTVYKVQYLKRKVCL